MVDFTAYADLDATALAGEVRRGRLSCEEIADTAQRAIALLNPHINAFVSTEIFTGKTLPDGPFRGVPIALKDCIADMKGAEFSFGSRLASGTVAACEGEIVTRLRKSGFQLLGLTNVPELSSSVTTEPVLHGPAHNPWALGHSTGGSSGGAAAAVAAGLVPVAYANDGAGSIRVPASCCGVFGLKPSRGRIPTGPDKNDYWHGLVCHNVLTRTVRDCAAVMDATAGLDVGAPYTAPPLQRPLAAELGKPVHGLRVHYCLDAPNGVPVSEDCRAAVLSAAELLGDLGCIVSEARPTWDGTHLDDVTALIGVSLASDLPAFSKATARAVGPETVERCNLAWAERGARLPATELQRILYGFGRLGRELGRFFAGCDLLLTPTLALPPPPHGWLDADSGDLDDYLGRFWRFSPFAPLANVTGVPAMSVPLHWNADGLPIGVMFTARYGDEATLIRMASALEAERSWIGRHPPHSLWHAQDTA